MPHLRGDLYDGSSLALGDHFSGYRLRDEEQRLDIEIHDPVVVLLGNVDEELRHVGAGIVDQDVHSFQPADAVFHLSQVCNVADKRTASASVGLYLPDHRVQFGFGATDCHHIGAGAGECQRRSAANSTTGSGDQGHLAVYPH